MAMILLNSADLLRVDLKGVNVILPDLVVALEAVLGDQELKMSISAALSKADLRRNSISLLISMIYLPLHFEVRKIRCILQSKNLDQFAADHLDGKKVLDRSRTVNRWLESTA